MDNSVASKPTQPSLHLLVPSAIPTLSKNSLKPSGTAQRSLLSRLSSRKEVIPLLQRLEPTPKRLKAYSTRSPLDPSEPALTTMTTTTTTTTKETLKDLLSSRLATPRKIGPGTIDPLNQQRNPARLMGLQAAEKHVDSSVSLDLTSSQQSLISALPQENPPVFAQPTGRKSSRANPSISTTSSHRSIFSTLTKKEKAASESLRLSLCRLKRGGKLRRVLTGLLHSDTPLEQSLLCSIIELTSSTNMQLTLNASLAPNKWMRTTESSSSMLPSVPTSTAARTPCSLTSRNLPTSVPLLSKSMGSNLQAAGLVHLDELVENQSRAPTPADRMQQRHKSAINSTPMTDASSLKTTVDTNTSVRSVKRAVTTSSTC